MFAILNSLNSPNFPIFQPILMLLYQNSWFIELFLIKHTIYRVTVPFKVQVGMFVQQRLQSVCASAQSNQSLSFSPEETLNP